MPNKAPLTYCLGHICHTSQTPPRICIILKKRERLDPHGVVIFDGSVKPRFCREAPQCQGAILWHYQAKTPSGYAPQCRSAITKGTTRLCQSAITSCSFSQLFPAMYIYDLSIYITPIALLLLFPYHATNITGGNIKAGKKAAQGAYHQRLVFALSWEITVISIDVRSHNSTSSHSHHSLKSFPNWIL